MTARVWLDGPRDQAVRLVAVTQGDRVRLVTGSLGVDPEQPTRGVWLDREHALSLATWLALGAGYVLTPDPSGEGVRAREHRG